MSDSVEKRVCRAVRLNTAHPDDSSPQSASASLGPLVALLDRAGIDPTVAQETIQSLAESNRLFVYRDTDGTTRVAEQTRDGIEALVAEENQSEHPDTAFIEDCIDALPQ